MNLQKQRITETLEKNYMPYAMSVIVSRAIPEIDGFKPSHRKLLYTMYKMKLLGGSRMKSANVVGQTMKLNPHGDQAIYATMVRLTRGYDALTVPYVDSKGNFGKVTSRDMKYAAARYTEVRLDDVCSELFRDIDKDVVDFVDSYDGRMKEPLLLPTTFPNVLINANKGIAVGMASSICSYNLHEVIDATIAYIDNPEVDIHSIVKAPDFSTGGYLLYKEKEMRSVLDNGLGSFKLRGKYRFVKEENIVEVYEIPYTTTVEAIIEKVVELIKGGKVKEITDIRDETDISGLKIAIDLRKGTDVDLLMSKLYKFTTLEDSFSTNFNILINGKPRVLGFKEVVHQWIDFRVNCIRRKTLYEIKELSEKLHLLEGLKLVLLDIDKAIKIVRETLSDKEVIPNLMVAFGIDELQAEFIADIKLRNLNKDYVLNRVAEIDNMKATLDKLTNINKSDKLIKNIIKKELNEVSKKYSIPRKTEILYEDEVIKYVENTEIEDFNCKFFVTDHGYIKKISLVSLRASGNHKVKDDDTIVREMDGTNKDDLLIFTDRQNCYKIRASEIEDHKASNLGSYIPNILDLEEGEKPVYVVNTIKYEGEMIFAFKNGKLAKVPISSYETKTYRRKLVKAYSGLSDLVAMCAISKDEDIILIRHGGGNEITASLVNSSLIPQKITKNTSGVQVIRLKKGSILGKMVLLNEVYDEIHNDGENEGSEDSPNLETENAQKLGKEGMLSADEYAELVKFKTVKIPTSGSKINPVDIMGGKFKAIV